MKKIIIATLIGVAAVAPVAACGDSDTGTTRPTTNGASSTTAVATSTDSGFVTGVPASSSSGLSSTTELFVPGVPAPKSTELFVPGVPAPTSTELFVPGVPAPDQGYQPGSNPASNYCIEVAEGHLETRSNPDGSQYGACILSDGRAIEEWDLFNASR